MSSHEKSTTHVECTKSGDSATVKFMTSAGVPIFSSRVLGELGTIVARIAEDAHVRFVIFRGDGRTFLAGADIAEMSHFTEDQGRAFSQHGHNVFNAVANLPQATFAAINGHALGGGCELAMACDFRIAAASARIGQPESRLGLIPGWAGTVRLPKLVGASMARKLLFSGEAITAAEAQRIGLVDEVVPTAEELDAALARWCKALLPGSPAAIRRIKRALSDKGEVAEFGKCFSCEDAREGMAAFHEKRPAAWVASQG